MEKGGRRPTQCFEKKYLPCRAWQQVCASHYFRDAHVGIVHYTGEVICGQIIVTPHNKVAKVPARHKGLQPALPIVKSHRASIRHAETP